MAEQQKFDSLMIDPETVQIGQMQKKEGSVDVPIATGRDGNQYFRWAGARELVGFSHHRLSRLDKEPKEYHYRLDLEHRMRVSLKGERDLVLGVDAKIEDGKIVYTNDALAIWAPSNTSYFPIT